MVFNKAHLITGWMSHLIFPHSFLLKNKKISSKVVSFVSYVIQLCIELHFVKSKKISKYKQYMLIKNYEII